MSIQTEMAVQQLLQRVKALEEKIAYLERERADESTKNAASRPVKGAR